MELYGNTSWKSLIPYDGVHIGVRYPCHHFEYAATKKKVCNTC